MNAMVLYAHPCEDSFASALHRQVLASLERRWQVDDCDLYAEGFDPVMSGTERRDYHDPALNHLPVRHYVERLQKAEALVLVFPVWNMGFPAILKGFLDRVFLPGVSFRMQDGRTVPAMSHIRKLAAVTTYGGSRLRVALAGDPPRRVVCRMIAHSTGVRARYLALYDMNRADAARREGFLTRVGHEMESF